MGVPSIVSVTLGSGGSQFTVTWSEAVDREPGATITLSSPARLASHTATYQSGTGTAAIVYTASGFIVYQNETVEIQAAAGLVSSVSTDDPSAAFEDQAVTNGSTQTLPTACDGRARGMMTQKCMVLRETETQSSTSAGVKTTWAPIYWPVCCSIQGRSSREAYGTGKPEDAASYIGYFPASLDLRATDRICQISGGGVRGLSQKILTVVGKPIDHAGRGGYLAAPLETVEGNDAGD